MKKDVLLNQGLIGLSRDIEIQASPDNECWAILSEEYTGDNPRPFLEQWDYFKTIARRLLETGGK